jgi:hypothetical protein
MYEIVRHIPCRSNSSVQWASHRKRRWGLTRLVLDLDAVVQRVPHHVHALLGIEKVSEEFLKHSELE